MPATLPAGVPRTGPHTLARIRPAQPGRCGLPLPVMPPSGAALAPCAMAAGGPSTQAARQADEIGHVPVWARLARVGLRLASGMVETLLVAGVVALAAGRISR